MTRFALPALVLGLAACGAPDSDDAEGDAVAEAGTYEVDATTGETRAQITNEDGTTTLVAGEAVEARLPDGFTTYPGAQVINSVNVGREKGRAVILSFSSEDTPEQIVDFYRKQAKEAGIAIELSLEAGAITMIGGEAPDGTTMTLQVDRSADPVTGQLTVSRGLN